MISKKKHIDPLLKDVANLVCYMQQCNPSIIQRRFNIGYNRACRIIDQLEAIGLVGPSIKMNDRKVLCDECQNIDNLLDDYRIVDDNNPEYQYDMNDKSESGNKNDYLAPLVENIEIDGLHLCISKMCMSNYISDIWNEEGSNSFFGEIGNYGIRQERTIFSHNLYILKYRIELQFSEWMKLEERNAKLEQSNYKDIYGCSNVECYSKALNERYKKDMEYISNILSDCLVNQHNLDLDEVFKCNLQNPTPKPVSVLEKKLSKWDEENPLILEEFPEEPVKPTQELYSMKLSFMDKMLPYMRKKKEQQALNKYNEAYIDYENNFENWKKEIKRINEKNEIKKKQYESERNNAIRCFQKEDNQEQKEWEEQEQIVADSIKVYEEEKMRFNEKCMSRDGASIEDYCCAVLDKSIYNYPFIKEFTIEYNGNGLLVVEYRLPDTSDLPKYKECKYISSSNQARKKEISVTEQNRIYDKMLYDISLRCIYELFDADSSDAINSICFNGWVRTIDKATGNKVINCILSVQVSKDEFAKIDLSNVDSKLCFKSLKGVSASKLFQLTPIKPILNINREDNRFVESKDIASGLDDSTNLASMDWEDFEYLVREIFEKEFSGNGGEVKITQASRDGGVDAVAFDPDPIRGGKIVIQAKRYTNTVGVSSVRDLWGTVMNEGAMKGLLVTTSDFGADSYDFAKDKPITLINGANLLYLLEKHGIHAKIDIKEAKNKNERI